MSMLRVYGVILDVVAELRGTIETIERRDGDRARQNAAGTRERRSQYARGILQPRAESAGALPRCGRIDAGTPRSM
jgi:hypothetical protein